MLFLLILLLSLIAIGADVLHDRRQRRRRRIRCRGAFIAWAAVTDSLPLIVAAVGMLNSDNSTTLMLFAQWALYLWMLTVPPRIAYYTFNFVGLRRTGIVVGLLIAAIILWGGTIGRTRLRVSRTEVCTERLPAGFDGFRIVQLADIHLGTLVRPERELRRIVDSVNALRPDLVVFCGDLVNIRYTELDERSQHILSGIKAPYGVVSVLGNHDVGAYVKDTAALPYAENMRLLVARQQAMGWQVLQDTTVLLARRGDTISLSGIAFDVAVRERRHDPKLQPADLAATYGNVPDTLYNITAVHVPQFWDRIREYGYGDLTLSGHVHAMQLKVTLGERSFSPAQWIYDRWSGRYDVDGHTLYINDGTGYVAYPMRLGAWPEISLITLRKCA